MTTVSFASSTSWTLPPDWNPYNNEIICIGPGGNGATGGSSGGGGGGGGACAISLNVNVSNPVSIVIGAGGSGQTTSFGSVCSAGGGGTASGTTPGSGGFAITFNSFSSRGGLGGSSGASVGGGGGGGAGGQTGNGIGGVTSGTNNGGAGGAGDAGSAGGGAGGAGGIVFSNGPVVGSPGSDGSGGGGGGAQWSASSPAGAAGGAYGAGGGGGGNGTAGGAGYSGFVIVIYTPLIEAPFNHDFPNPRIPVTLNNRTHIHRNVLYLGQDQFYGIGGPEYDYPNPKGYQYPSSLRTHTNPSNALSFVGQDMILLAGVGPNYDYPNPVLAKPNLGLRTFTQFNLNIANAAVAATFYGTGQSLSNYDWPVPKGYIFSNELRSFLNSTNIKLIAQDVMFGGPAQTKNYDYPNPIPYRRANELLTFLHDTPFWLIGLDKFFGVAGNPNEDWPVPKGYPPARFLFQHLHNASNDIVPRNPNAYGIIIG